MAITSVAFFMVKKNQPGSSLGRWLVVLAGLLALDLSLFGACLTKLEGGGFVPLLIALAVSLVMLIWSKGRGLVHAAIQKTSCPPAELARRLSSEDMLRVPGTHVFVLRMASPEYGVARVLEQRRRNQVLPHAVVLLELEADWHDAMAAVGTIEVTGLPAGVWQVRATHGYMVEPDVPMILEKARVEHGVELPPGPVFYFLCQEIIQTCTRRQMRHGEKLLFGFLSRNVLPGPDYLSIPPDQLIVYNWILRLAPSDGACS
jgi:KUP system potassium uptake protein